ncbi:hypothetical protein ACETRX_22930 [Labrys portucalensis]|uniref:Tail assembly chaperone n=1 Tax=Labrys neptuniae TaxID=376174 RepID=A0ABV6ZK16_9HYPH
MSTEVPLEIKNDEPISASFANMVGRSEAVPLTWPVIVDGKLWTEITVRRVTAGEVEAYVKALQVARDAGLPIDDIQLPLIEAPTAVIKALDDDDAFRIDEVAQSFLPRRFRAEEASKSTQEIGEGS